MNREKTWNDYFAEQIHLPEMGEDRQHRLAQAKALIVGVGGPGCAASTYLALAGVGTIGLMDFNMVETSGLQRQPLFTTEDIGQARVDVAARSLERIVPWLTAVSHQEAFSVDSGLRLAPDYDILLDCTDNMTAHREINQVAVFLKKPSVYASIKGMSAELSLFVPDSSPCFHCNYPDVREPGPRREGVFAALAGMIGTLQAAEAVKYMAGIGQPTTGRLMHFAMDSLKMSETPLSRNPDCTVCGSAAQTAWNAPDIREISIDEFLDRRRATGMLVVDVRESDEYQSLRLRDSVSIPLSDLPDSLETLPRDRPILTICNAGIKSRSAARILKKHNFADVFSLRGRILTLWKSYPDLFGT